ncbi:Putative predicted metal-dependent hydrolase [hydrothermal vent metagenome]|uniref:Putative predicted metal-dependent hydrolase n=1 Tax=hydrothermal vent metagenome TaxID=652676 RepID=A0A1W1CF16_9ZZZZ
MEYKLIRSNRKTLAIEISQNAQLIVRAPQKLSIKKVENFINEKQNWINKKIIAIKKSLTLGEFKYTDNEKHLFLGEKYPIKLTTEQDKELIFFQNTFYLKHPINNPKEVFMNWYLTIAKKHLINRVEFFAKIHNLNYKKIKVNKAKTRWGSCSYDNNLNFNYRLIITPEFVLDYVVIHELAHTIHKNHSKDFWDFVAIMMPKYKNAKNWLKQYGGNILRVY